MMHSYKLRINSLQIHWSWFVDCGSHHVTHTVFESCGQKEISCFTNCVLHVVKVWPYTQYIKGRKEVSECHVRDI